MNARRIACLALLGAALALPAAAQAPQGPGVTPGTGPVPAQRQRYRFNQRNTYGWGLMTPEERSAHREKMLSMHSFAECKAYQAEEHARMQERAHAQGKTLPAPRYNACDRMKARGLLK